MRPCTNVRVVTRPDTAGTQEWIVPIPRRGDPIELLLPRLGIRQRGTVFYADHLQVLVKWDDDRSEACGPPGDRFRMLDPTEKNDLLAVVHVCMKVEGDEGARELTAQGCAKSRPGALGL
jgi:hypothetical protein